MNLQDARTQMSCLGRRLRPSFFREALRGVTDLLRTHGQPLKSPLFLTPQEHMSRTSRRDYLSPGYALLNSSLIPGLMEVTMVAKLKEAIGLLRNLTQAEVEAAWEFSNGGTSASVRLRPALYLKNKEKGYAAVGEVRKGLAEAGLKVQTAQGGWTRVTAP